MRVFGVIAFLTRRITIYVFAIVYIMNKRMIQEFALFQLSITPILFFVESLTFKVRFL